MLSDVQIWNRSSVAVKSLFQKYVDIFLPWKNQINVITPNSISPKVKNYCKRKMKKRNKKRKTRVMLTYAKVMIYFWDKL